MDKTEGKTNQSKHRGGKLQPYVANCYLSNLITHIAQKSSSDPGMRVMLNHQMEMIRKQILFINAV
jgi:hypothetical protein